MRLLLIILACVTISLNVNAQSTFRIYDAQMNDLTSGNVFITDTNSGVMSLNLWVLNTDSLSHSVKARRVVVMQPPAASNAFTWGMYQYAPNVDTAAVAVTIAPAAMDTFIGYYFPDSLSGVATIDYCFWETANPANSSCVTVYYENHIHAGINTTSGSQVSVGPNPAETEFVASWTGTSFVQANVYAADGKLIMSDWLAESQTQYLFGVSDLAPGIYFLQLIAGNGQVSNHKFVH